MTWLVTGGAGYVGAHIVRGLLDADMRVVVLDDFSTGRREFVPRGVPIVRGSLLDASAVRGAIKRHGVSGVVHVAGFKFGHVSTRRPLHTFTQNVEGTRVLLAAMGAESVDRIVFSSCVSVFGDAGQSLITESTPTAPASPYAESKLIGEWLVRDQGVAVGLRSTSLRYFNVVGSGDPVVRDVSPHNLFPIVFDTLLAGRVPSIYGVDYPTPDGTTVRDYVHVADVAQAHVAAARHLDSGGPLEPVYTLGSGSGSSVAEIMAAAARVTGMPFEPEIAPRRVGDPPRVVVGGALAARDLSWAMRHTLDDMMGSAWEARRAAAARAGEAS